MDTTTIIVLGATALVAFGLTALLGKWMIPVLHRLKFGQTIRDVGPAWHKNKQGTPTMGGLLFIIGSFITVTAAMVVCWIFWPDQVFSGNTAYLTRLFAGVIMALGCGAIGFLDDYIKVVKKRNLGLTSLQKLLAQLLVAAAYAVSIYMAGGTAVIVPFVGLVDFGFWYIPFTIFVIVAASNATNLTDGIDGLCGTVSLVVTLFFLTLSGQYLGQGISAAAMAGALVGFLLWNLHPAKVFMGDTGSLFIGGMLCSFAFGINQPFLLVPAGIIYIVETLSVMLQVTYFKLTHGKRLFKMSPLHHHCEMCGWSENKIVVVFSLITLAGCILGGWMALA